MIVKEAITSVLYDMKKELNLRIPEPCHENWNEMTPNARGRHCDSCAKTVIDFTTKSDDAIIKIYETHQNLCGRFKMNQLNRPLIMERREKSAWTSVAAAAAFTLMTLQSVDGNAQNEPKTVQMDSVHNGQLKGKIAVSVLKHRIIKGTVLDADSIPLAGANIIIKGTTTGTVADFDGNYSLRVKNGDVLVCSSIGYQTAERVVKYGDSNDFNLTMTEDIMGELVVVGGLVAGDYEYVLSPEELEEEKRLRKLRNENNRKFYKRKRLEERERKREKRQDKKKL